MTACGFSRLLKPFWADLTEFLLPHRCAGCGFRPIGQMALLCPECLHDLTTAPVPKSLPGATDLFERTFSGFIHEGLVRQMIHLLKYGGREDIGVFLGAIVAGRMDSRFPARVDRVVPIPLHPVRLRERGYNQAAIIARSVAQVREWPYAGDLLFRVRSTQSQTRMNREDRLRNLSGGFAVAPGSDIRGKTILLVDDVTTTGATLKAGAEALHRAGASDIFLLTIARA